jgi:putative sensory transduction regulator
MIRILAAASFLALAACASTGSPSGAAATDGLIDRYDEQALRSIFEELDYTVEDKDVSSSGKPFMTVETSDGLSFRVMGESCEGQGAAQVCQGVQLSTQFAPAGDADFDEIIARANRTLRPAKLFWAGDTIAYERYLIMDGGVPRENLKTNITVYVEILQVLTKQLLPDQQPVKPLAKQARRCYQPCP